MQHLQTTTVDHSTAERTNKDRRGRERKNEGMKEKEQGWMRGLQAVLSVYSNMYNGFY